MFDDVNESERGYKKDAAWRGSMTVIILNQLNGIPYEEGERMVSFSSYGVALRQEETKAWWTPPYWAYRWICEEYGLQYHPALEYYNTTDLLELEDILYKKLFPEE